jgi:hypothetical protein
LLRIERFGKHNVCCGATHHSAQFGALNIFERVVPTRLLALINKSPVI